MPLQINLLFVICIRNLINAKDYKIGLKKVESKGLIERILEI